MGLFILESRGKEVSADIFTLSCLGTMVSPAPVLSKSIPLSQTSPILRELAGGKANDYGKRTATPSARQHSVTKAYRNPGIPGATEGQGHIIHDENTGLDGRDKIQVQLQDSDSHQRRGLVWRRRLP